MDDAVSISIKNVIFLKSKYAYGMYGNSVLMSDVAIDVISLNMMGRRFSH